MRGVCLWRFSPEVCLPACLHACLPACLPWVRRQGRMQRSLSTLEGRERHENHCQSLISLLRPLGLEVLIEVAVQIPVKVAVEVEADVDFEMEVEVEVGERLRITELKSQGA